MARWQETRPQYLRPYPRGVRGEAENVDHGDEGGNCGSAAVDGYGQGRWATDRGEEGQAGKEEINRTATDVEYSASVTVKYDYLRLLAWFKNTCNFYHRNVQFRD